MSKPMTTDDAQRPPEPKTKEIPAASPVEIALAEIQVAMKAGFRETNANIELVSGDLTAVKAEVRSLQTWKGEQEARSTKFSDRVRQESSHDLERDAKLSEVIVWRKGVEDRLAVTATKDDVARIEDKTDAQTAILDRLLAIADRPIVKMFLTAALTAATTWLGMKGLR